MRLFDKVSQADLTKIDENPREFLGALTVDRNGFLYRYVRYNPSTAGAAVAGRAAYWKDIENGEVSNLTADNKHGFAGVFINTPDNTSKSQFVWVLVRGVTTVQFGASTNVSVGDKLAVSSAAGTNGAFSLASAIWDTTSAATLAADLRNEPVLATALAAGTGVTSVKAFVNTF